MLGRGVDVPMPVILFGALGGMASGGILGMFVGATVLALGYEIFLGWVATNLAWIWYHRTIRSSRLIRIRNYYLVQWILILSSRLWNSGSPVTRMADIAVQ